MRLLERASVSYAATVVPPSEDDHRIRKIFFLALSINILLNGIGNGVG